MWESLRPSSQPLVQRRELSQSSICLKTSNKGEPSMARGGQFQFWTPPTASKPTLASRLHPIACNPAPGSHREHICPFRAQLPHLLVQPNPNQTGQTAMQPNRQPARSAPLSLLLSRLSTPSSFNHSPRCCIPDPSSS